MDVLFEWGSELKVIRELEEFKHLTKFKSFSERAFEEIAGKL